MADLARKSGPTVATTNADSKASAEKLIRTTLNLERLPLPQLRGLGKIVRLRGYNGEHDQASLAAALKAKVKAQVPPAKSTPAPVNAAAAARNAMRDRALAAYKPAVQSLAAADARLLAEIPKAVAAQAQVEVVSTAALALSIRDVVHFLMSPEALKERINPDAGAAAKVMAHVRKVASATETITEKTGNVERIMERRQLWEGVSRPTWTYAIKAALLCWAGDTTGLTIGYLDKAPGNRLIAEIEWKATGKVPGIVAPYNVLRPNRYRDIAAVADKDGNYLGADPVPVTETVLKWVNNAQITALYDHHFNGAALYYDDRVASPNAVPTGILAKGMRPERTPAAGTGASTLQTVTDKLASDDPQALLLAVATMIRDKPTKEWNVKDRNSFLASALAVGRMAAEWCDRNNVTVSEQFCRSKGGTELAELYRTVTRICSTVNPGRPDEVVMTVVDNRNAQALDSANKSILPDAPKAATKAAAA